MVIANSGTFSLEIKDKAKQNIILPLFSTDADYKWRIVRVKNIKFMVTATLKTKLKF